MVTIYIDNHPYEVEAGQNLLHACLTLKLNLPYFCWHPALGSVGACRQCAVKQFKDEADTRGRIVMACMTPATPGARIAIEDPEAKAFRASVIEWLMENHPHDCPVCDEGGECHLQDMTLMTGHTVRRYRFPKRTYRNQDLGPFITHEMNRCIQCYRCVRYYRDYAGGRDLDVFGAHDEVYFGRHEDGALESPFAGNLVEVCPTGVFTDKTLGRHYTRKWDLQTAPTVCVHCSVGCNTIAGERYGTLRRILNRYHSEVNGYFLCDRGRFGYEFVNAEERVRQPLVRRDGSLRTGARADVVARVGGWLREGTVVGIGSPRASLESNFALRALVGPARFHLGMPAGEAGLVRAILAILRQGPARSPSLREVGLSDAVLVLGEDVTSTAPMLGLALRQAARQQPLAAAEALHIPRWQDLAVRDVVQGATGPVYVATPAATGLDDLATRALRAAPEEIARLGFAVAAALGGAAGPGDLTQTTAEMARDIAGALRGAARPVIVSGTGLGSRAVIEAAANVAWALAAGGRPAGLAYAVPECNSLGLTMMEAGDLQAAFDAARRGEIPTAVILENDLYRRAPTPEVDDFLRAVRHVVVLDHVRTATSEQAQVVLPAATFAEGDGTLVSQEGRAQRFHQVLSPAGDVQESWRWIGELLAAAGRSEGEKWDRLDAIDQELREALPVFAAIADLASQPGARGGTLLESVPRQSHRYSGRTAMVAHRSVHEPAPPADPDSPLVFSMEARPPEVPPGLIPLFWAPGWNSAQAVTKFQAEVNGPLAGGDPGRRLLEPANGAGPRYFTRIPEGFVPRPGQVLVVPLHHVFGSEELSARGRAIAERMPPPALLLSEADAAALGIAPGAPLVLELDGLRVEAPLGAFSGLPPGLAGVPVGLPGLPWVPVPGWGTVRRA